MARTEKSRTTAYDNVAIGSAVSTRERTILGSTAPDFTAIGNGENIAIGDDYGAENQQEGVDVIAIERLTR
jgi:hypothetical protein